MTTVVLVGNGLSVGFDARLSGRSITERVMAAVDDDLRALLDRVVHLGQPESPDQPLEADRGGFEQLAGPLDRLAEALIAVQDLLGVAGDSEAVRGLGDASQELRRQYFRIVGTVLREVDACCIEPEPDDARRAAWQRLNDFAAQLVDWNGGQNKITVFTLNYDSLLLSSMLVASEWVYDGFRGLTLNHPLDRWSNPALYHLHGSVSWIRGREGIVSKKRLDVMRLENILDRWVEGDVAIGQPSVVLTDLKTPVAARYPFALMYEEFARSLSMALLAVAAGYGFGDRPVNRTLALYLAQDSRRRLLVWSREVDTSQVLDRLKAQLTAGEGTIVDDQVTAESVVLPDPDAVRRLRANMGE